MRGQAESTKNPVQSAWAAISGGIILPSLIVLTMPVAVHASARSNYEIGAAAFKSKDYAKAAKFFELGIQQTKGDPNLHYGLASTLQAVGQSTQARDEYRKCIDLAPTSKLAEYSRVGLSYIESKEIASLPPLPAPSPPQFSGESQSAWHTPGPMPPSSGATGLPPNTLQTSSGGGGMEMSGFPSLPAPTPASYGPNSGIDPSSFMGYAGMHHHHGRHGYAPSPSHYAPYSPYAFGPPHTPVMQIRTYRPAPPLNIQSSNAQPKAEKPQEVELMAKQGKLVIDEQPTTGANK